MGELVACLKGGEVDGREVDWGKVAGLAGRHRVDSLLYYRLERSAGRATVPAPVYAGLRMAYYSAADQNIRKYHSLGPVLACLRRQGIPVILLKGVGLAELVYPNLALRPMGDADLLVPRADLHKARSALLEYGCVHQSEDIDTVTSLSHQLAVFVVPEPGRAGATAASAGSSSGSAKGLVIELHWSIEAPVSPFRIRPEDPWDKARPVLVGGAEAMLLGPEDMLLHTCLHAVWHHRLMLGLGPLWDCAFIIEKYRGGLDWQELAKRAQDWQVGRQVGLGLLLARDLAGADVPEDLPERLIPGGIAPELYAAARECVLAQRLVDQGRPRTIPELVGTGTFRQRLRILWRRAAAPGGAARGWSHYLRPRLARLLGRVPDRDRNLADWLAGAELNTNDTKRP